MNTLQNTPNNTKKLQKTQNFTKFNKMRQFYFTEKGKYLLYKNKIYTDLSDHQQKEYNDLLKEIKDTGFVRLQKKIYKHTENRIYPKSVLFSEIMKNIALS